MKYLLCILISLNCSISFSQQKEEDQSFGHSISVTTGPFLPNQIDNVTEIQPSWGLGLFIPKDATSGTEYSITNSNAKGVEYFILSASARGEAKLDEFVVGMYAGLSLHRYRTTATGSDWTNLGGFHVGAAMLTPIGKALYFRSDMKFAANPGTSLYLGFGFEIRYPKSEDAEADSK